ncbi:MAG TPA: hypothetical protein DCY78_00565 [Acidimicrobiaceae bacterium]|nr:hypothetical protein [Acidimicrobiaceae bacterium]HAZ35839.1 hypothetical protein [Acidimicrobiaceae bacterium]HAZ55710.1 hypothetical protein [Acidimicrobiaceae bacterium]HIE67046.1 antibiotic biosynthesis monooxygenase [Acidimicrobiia bacterium]HIL48195.1 antibiotic biosynthesis monooxygenase [Acidimicrobiia bacterium]
MCAGPGATDDAVGAGSQFVSHAPPSLAGYPGSPASIPEKVRQYAPRRPVRPVATTHEGQHPRPTSGGPTMLVIAGTINLDPDHLNEMLAAIVPLMEATQAEEGCIDYVLSADPKEPGTIRIFEKWASDEALGAHMKAPHMGVFQKAIRGCGVTGMSVDKFEIASESKLV